MTRGEQLDMWGGGGFLTSERAAAERAAAIVWQLSEREREIVKTLRRDDA